MFEGPSVEEEVEGRLRYDHSGSFFYTEYKPLLDKLYYLVGTTSQDDELLQKHRVDLKELLKIERQYREHHMYKPELEQLKDRVAELTAAAENLERIADAAEEEKERLTGILQGMEEVRGASSFSEHFQKQLEIYKKWEIYTTQANTLLESLSYASDRIKDELEPSYEALLVQANSEIAIKQAANNELTDEEVRLQALREHTELSIVQKNEELEKGRQQQPARPTAEYVEKSQRVLLSFDAKKNETTEVVNLPPSANRSHSVFDLKFSLCVLIALLTIWLLAKW